MQLNEKMKTYKDKIRCQLKKKLFANQSDISSKISVSSEELDTPLRINPVELNFEDQYILKEKIGEGAHAVVILAEHIESKQIYAVKKFRTDDPEIIATIRKSYQISQPLNHPNLVRVRELFINEQKGYCYQVMEYCKYPSLEVQIETLTETQTQIAIKQLLEAIRYLHKQGVCHRDIKPDNILFDGTHLKIIDYGVSRKFIQKNKAVEMWTSTGTSYYCAPEIYEGAGYMHKIDIWAIGVVLDQCLTKQLPFKDETVFGTIDLICKAKLPDHPALNPLTRDLLLRLLNRDPKTRLNAKDALQHIWFENSKQAQKCSDDLQVNNPMNNSSLYIPTIMSQSIQGTESVKPEKYEKPEPFRQTIHHVKQKSSSFRNE